MRGGATIKIKKTLFIAGMIAAPISMAMAKQVKITFDTQVKWPTSRIETALNKSGFIGGSGANWDVRVTRNRILQDLLKRNSFSLNDAARVCLDKCNMSDFLKKGKGASGKKCPELCKTFSYSFVKVVKSGAKSTTDKSNTSNLVEKQSDGTYKIWTKDKKYYALYGTASKGFHKQHPSLQKYNNICNWRINSVNGMYEPLFVAFDSKLNKPIALLGLDTADKAYDLLDLCTVDGYHYLEFSAEPNSSYEPAKFIVKGYSDSEQINASRKVYSKDKKYYALMTNDLSKYRNICGDWWTGTEEDYSGIVGVVFISQSNIPIGYLHSFKTHNTLTSTCVKREYEKQGNKCIYFEISGQEWHYTGQKDLSVQFVSPKNLYLEYGYSDNCWY